MIEYKQGDIFTSDCEAIINTVNTKGIMGKGLALQFKKRYPDNFKAYEKACENEQVQLGKMFIFNRNTLDNPKYIINFPTKGHWKSKSKLKDIEEGFDDLLIQLAKYNIKSVAIPPLGSGLGGLDWKQVKTIISAKTINHDGIDFVVYEPLETKNPSATNLSRKKLTPLRTLVLEAFNKYLIYAETTSITFVEAHKLCYLLQEAGAPLRLRISPYIYGPYASNLSFVFSELEGEYITGFGDGTASAFETFSLIKQNQEITLSDEHKTILTNVINYISGFEFPTGMELLSTIHWLVYHEHTQATLTDIKYALKNWGKEKNKEQDWGKRKINLFSDYEIEKTLEHLLKNSLSPAKTS